MGIVDEDIVRVRENADIVQVISQYTQLKRVGRRFTGLCPFHGEKTPSFSVNAEDGLYYCFGCQAKGDTITFVREKEQLDFVGAVEWLANKSNIELRYTDANEGEDRKRRARLFDAIGSAVDWYHERLLKSPDAGAARSYLRQRGFTGDDVRHYQMGWAPDGWDHLARALRLNNKDLVDSGLGFINSRGRAQDAFRARVLFPIFDAQGRPVGFGGRILPGSSDPAKYKNSSESKVYAKSRVLYGLNWAKTDIVAADEVIVCEGYTDVIGFAQAGVPRAVATCGTALTDDHVKLLRRFARRVVLSFDADAAGQNAAARFYEWEKAHDLDVAVVDLPEGADPGELAQSDPERLVAAVTDAKPFLAFRVERALAAGDLNTAEGRARTAESALAMVAEHPDMAVRDAYVMDVADHCRLEHNIARQMLAAGPRPQPRNAQRGASHGGAPTRVARRRVAERDTPEFEALKVLAGRPDEIGPLIVPELFHDELYADTYRAIVSHPSIPSAIDEADAEVGDLLQRLSVLDSDAEGMDVAGRLWQRYLERRVDDCVRDARLVREPERLRQLSEEMAWFKAKIAQLPAPESRGPTVEGLLAWFHQSSGEGEG